MMNSLNSFVVILIFGALILLTFLLFANPLRVNKKANFQFGVFLFLLSTYWLDEVLVFVGVPRLSGGLLLVVKCLQFLMPLFFYYSTVYYSDPNYKLAKVDMAFFILPILYLVGLVWKDNFISLPQLDNAVIILQAFCFILFAFFVIQRHKKRMELFESNTDESDLRWIEQIIIASFLLLIFIGVYNFLFTSKNLNLLANTFSLAIF